MPKKRSAKRSKHRKKFRLLLDAAFAGPSNFPLLGKKANITHIVHSHQLSYQADDSEIYNLAIKENRFVVTINYKHFKKLVKLNRPGVIAIPAYLSNTDIEKLLIKFMSGKDPENYIGKTTKLS